MLQEDAPTRPAEHDQGPAGYVESSPRRTVFQESSGQAATAMYASSLTSDHEELGQEEVGDQHGDRGGDHGARRRPADAISPAGHVDAVWQAMMLMK